MVVHTHTCKTGQLLVLRAQLIKDLSYFQFTGSIGQLVVALKANTVGYLGIELIEIPDRAYTGKNSADIRLAVDAVEICLTRDHIDTFAILSGDSDFSPLVSKLKEFGKMVVGVGMKEATSTLLAENCDEFIFYEDIVSTGGFPNFQTRVPREKHSCYQLLLETVDALQHESDGAILASLLKNTMKRKRPQFSERSFGYRSFTQLLQEAANLGFIEIHQDTKSGTIAVDGLCE